MSHLVSAAPPITSAHTVKQYAGFGILGADIPTSGDHGASPVLNDSISPTGEYHWRVETSPSAGVLTIYPDLSFEWDSSGAANGTYQWVYRLFENGQNQGTATVNLVLGAITLAIAKAFHGQSADSLNLTPSGSVSLTLQDALHAQAADAPSLTTQWLLAVADSLHGQSADSLLLATQWLLAVADALHAQAADALLLNTSNSVWLTLQEATHGHLADGVILTLSNWLAIAESHHGHAADSLLVDPGQRTLAIAEARHLHFADQLLLALPAGALVSDSKFIIALAARLLTVVAQPRNITINRRAS